MATGALTTKDEFRNTSEGWIGVVTIDGRGEHYGMPVAPGETAWLSEEEQIATANAPKSDADNPFTNGVLVLVTRAREVKNRRPYGGDQPVAKPEAPMEEPEATVEVAGEAQEGVHAPDEEVGTPEATSSAGRRRRQARAA